MYTLELHRRRLRGILDSIFVSFEITQKNSIVDSIALGWLVEKPFGLLSRNS